MFMITLYIGDNGSGKTRQLVNIIETSMNNGLSVVTNIPTFRGNYVIDEVKLQYFKDNIYNDMCKHLVLETPAKTRDEVICRRLVELLYSKGDILVLDELDCMLTHQKMIEICDCLSCISSLWKDIYVSGYDSDLTRMFVQIDEDNFETYNPNVYLMEDGVARRIAEEDIDDCFDELRW